MYLFNDLVKPLMVVLLILNFSACKPSTPRLEVEYIKVLSLGSTDSVNTYNKGMGIGQFLQYNPSSDSVIFQTVINMEPLRHNTYAGVLGQNSYREQLELLVLALKKYRTGFVNDTAYDGSMYCGPDYYVEFKDASGIHSYHFALKGDDTLSAFSDFFSAFLSLEWARQLIPDSFVNSDFEVVNAATRLGVYKQKVTPYIPLACEQRVDMSKIYGNWRRVNSVSNSFADHRKLTISRNGYWSLFDDQESVSGKKNSFRIVLKHRENRFILNTKEGQLSFKVHRLTENCFEFTMEGDKDPVRYDRL